MGEDGRPDFEKMTEEQRSKVREMFGGMGRRRDSTNENAGTPGMSAARSASGGGPDSDRGDSERRQEDSSQSETTDGESSDSGEASD